MGTDVGNRHGEVQHTGQQVVSFELPVLVRLQRRADVVIAGGRFGRAVPGPASCTHQLDNELSVPLAAALAAPGWCFRQVISAGCLFVWQDDQILGKGAFKVVNKAFDEQEGMEVAWNKVNLVDTASMHTRRGPVYLWRSRR